MKKGKGITAIGIRNFLTFVMVVIILGAVAGFYYGLQIVREYAVEVSHAVTDSTASGKSIVELSTLKRELAEREPLVTKANQLFSTPASYQAQALKDIQKYASVTGVTIANTEFSKTPAATPPTSPVVGTGEQSAIITLQSPTSYAKLLKFIDAIEGNLPKMQITGITVSRPTTASGDNVNTEKITITVATR